MGAWTAILCAAGVAVAASTAAAQPDDYDFDFVTIDQPGNPGLNRVNTRATHQNRGSVGYEYRMARTEINTAQWMEFVNVLSARGNIWASRLEPRRWGGLFDFDAPPGMPQYKLNPSLVDAGNVPVGGITFDQAAVYTNWLHNGKQSDDASLMSGAYDVVTLGFGDPLLVSTEHNPSAKYWIPTLDEWMKSVYWDPNKTDEDGWWLYPNMSDGIPLAGPPGVGETNAGYLDTRDDWTEFRVGEYTDSPAPWGLLDTSGGAMEWTESRVGFFNNLILKGASLGDLRTSGPISHDRVNAGFTGSSQIGSVDSGFRIASSIPAPGSSAYLLAAFLGLSVRRRR